MYSFAQFKDQKSKIWGGLVALPSHRELFSCVWITHLAICNLGAKYRNNVRRPTLSYGDFNLISLFSVLQLFISAVGQDLMNSRLLNQEMHYYQNTEKFALGPFNLFRKELFFFFFLPRGYVLSCCEYHRSRKCERMFD